MRRFDASWGYAQTGYHSKWDRYQKLYDSERVDVGYKGITNTFVPMTYSTVEALTAALTVGRPSTDFVPQDILQYATAYAENEQPPNLRALNALYDYYWDCDNWDVKSILTVKGGLKLGTSAEFLYWDIDKPRLVNLPLRDLIIDPNLVDPMQLITDPDNTYAGRRFFTTKKALRDVMVVDPETGELKKRYKNTGKIKGAAPSDKQDDKAQKDMRIGATTTGNADIDNEQVEVIEIWDGSKVVSIANRQFCIEETENPYKAQHRFVLEQKYLQEVDPADELAVKEATDRAASEAKGMIPVVVHRFIIDESQIYGKSIIQPIAKPQELLNDVTNQNVDAVTDALNPQYTLDPKYASWIPKMKNIPGTVYPFAANAYMPVVKASIPNSAFNERSNLKNEIREATGADQIVKGVTSDTKQTATEIRAQLNQSGQRFDIYVRMLEREAFYQRAKIVYRMIRLFVNNPVSVPTNTPDGTKFYTFRPEEFNDDYEPKIRLEANVESAKAEEQKQSIEAYEIVIADPSNNVYQAKKILYPKMFPGMNEEELDRIIGDEETYQQWQAAQMGGQPADPMAQMMQGLPQQGAPIEGEVMPQEAIA